MGISRYVSTEESRECIVLIHNYFELVYLHLTLCVIVCVYTSIICSILEYACPVWHPGLTKTLSKDIECVQKRCLKLLFPALSYTESLRKCGLERLDDRRGIITQSLFRKLKIQNTPYIICYLLLKCLIVRWFCGLHIHIKFHWPKLHVVEGTLYCIAFPRSSGYAA